jgi:hypothetical protein
MKAPKPGALQRLLDDGRGHDAQYGDGLSNHLPMALAALHALGADDQRLAAYAEAYAARLRPAPAAAAWEAGAAWDSRLGDATAFGAYRELFSRWLQRERPEALLPQLLPQLMRGCAAAAFHGLIRTAHGVAARHLGEVADGLAHWASAWQPIGDFAAAPGDETDPEVLLRLLRAGSSTQRLISDRVADAARDPQLAEVVSRLAIDDKTLPQLARLAAFAYAGSGNFTVLHLLTSAHALRLLLPFCKEPMEAVRWYWQAYATAVVAAAIRRRPEPWLYPWEQIVEAALASDDEHVIKLVHSCREQAKVYGGVAWQWAASRVLVD